MSQSICKRLHELQHGYLSYPSVRLEVALDWRDYFGRSHFLCRKCTTMVRFSKPLSMRLFIQKNWEFFLTATNKKNRARCSLPNDSADVEFSDLSVVDNIQRGVFFAWTSLDPGRDKRDADGSLL